MAQRRERGAEPEYVGRGARRGAPGARLGRGEARRADPGIEPAQRAVQHHAVGGDAVGEGSGAAVAAGAWYGWLRDPGTLIEGHSTLYAYGILSLVVFLETGALVAFLPGDSLLVVAGTYAAAAANNPDVKLQISLLLLNVCLVPAAIIGDATSYFIGSRLGSALYNRPDSRFFKKAHLEAARAFYEKHGGKAIIIARFMLGLGESGNFPAAIKTVAEWFPKKERALATGIFNAGTNVGALATPLLVPMIVTAPLLLVAVPIVSPALRMSVRVTFCAVLGPRLTSVTV